MLQNSIEANNTQSHALSLLHQMLGQNISFRPGQWEAIEAVAIKKQRALVVQRTGWGKSLVYFLATKLLRENGAGPTLLISPLLSLMRNQIDTAGKIGVRAYTINSANQKEWKDIENALSNDACDIMLISPERLNNDYFIKKLLSTTSGRLGLFVVDEVHCISDWGHDFRPDYQRIGKIIQALPADTPVLGTTATANNRVIADVQSQFGNSLLVFRGPLDRESLRLQNLFVGSRAERLAWLITNLPKFRGSGIIYCQIIQDTERITNWLKHKGFNAEAYHARDESELNRPELELAFLENRVKILVATVALGMGFDKPDIEFIIHFQRPGSVTAYYQQVGRAGRGIEKSYGILLCGDEDEDIQKFLINNSVPSQKAFEVVMSVIQLDKPISFDQILNKVNNSPGMVQRIIKLLQVEGVIIETRDGNELWYQKTGKDWHLDNNRIKKYIDSRWQEWYEINRYVHHNGCLMKFLQLALNDNTAHTCDRCSNCQKKGFSEIVSPELVIEAEDFLKECTIIIKPKEKAPIGLFESGKKIPQSYRNAPGQSLSYYGDVGWGKMVKSGKYQLNYYSDDLVKASAHLILNRWKPNPMPQWVTNIPSRKHPTLVSDLAESLARILNIQYIPVLERHTDAPEQKTMQNELKQARNVIDTMAVNGKILHTPVLLVDDIIDSGWTLAIAGYLLRMNGSGIVYPFTLAQASGRKSAK